MVGWWMDARLDVFVIDASTNPPTRLSIHPENFSGYYSNERKPKGEKNGAEGGGDVGEEVGSGGGGEQSAPTPVEVGEQQLQAMAEKMQAMLDGGAGGPQGEGVQFSFQLNVDQQDEPTTTSGVTLTELDDDDDDDGIETVHGGARSGGGDFGGGDDGGGGDEEAFDPNAID